MTYKLISVHDDHLHFEDCEGNHRVYDIEHSPITSQSVKLVIGSSFEVVAEAIEKIGAELVEKNVQD